MPKLKKKVLSLYLRTGCLRQLALNLYSDHERKARGMPPRQTARAGLGLAGAAGYAWQDEKMNELSTVFGAANVHINPKRTGNRPQSLDLADVLPVVQPYQFIAEGRYAAETTTFCTSVNIHTLRDQTGAPLGVGEVLPDIIQVLPSMLNRPPWELPPEDSEPLPSMLEVLSSGAARQLAPADQRLRLRVIDIKQAAEPGAHYFAEVVYYSLTLAAWLDEHGWSDRFVVVAAPAVWPGSYDASALMQERERCRKEGHDPTPAEMVAALETDIELAPFDVFAPGRSYQLGGVM
jgi:hypothetical protein